MPPAIRTGLKAVRRRRWALWLLILAYVPAILIAQRVTGSDRGIAVVFGVWVLLVGVASVRAAFVRCPRCGNYFHMQAFIPVYLRRCVHCELHLTADRHKPGA